MLRNIPIMVTYREFVIFLSEKMVTILHWLQIFQNVLYEVDLLLICVTVGNLQIAEYAIYSSIGFLQKVPQFFTFINVLEVRFVFHLFSTILFILYICMLVRVFANGDLGSIPG